MKVSEVAAFLEADVFCGKEHLDMDVYCACGADLMSDVLAFVKHDAILLTGLVNPHVIRTADMMDIIVVVFVRGKIPTDDVLEIAKEKEIVILSTGMTMFTACGTLFKEGLIGGWKEEG